jgi:PAS domain S-box-containing protein
VTFADRKTLVNRQTIDETIAERPEPRSPTAPASIAHDWATTPLGSVESWAIGLQNAANLVFAHPLPMIMLWEKAFLQIYNRAYQNLLPAHIGSSFLGQPFADCYPETWSSLQPTLQNIFQTGIGVQVSHQPLTDDPMGDRPQTFFCSPLWDGDQISGILMTGFETAQSETAQSETAQSDTAQSAPEQQPPKSNLTASEIPSEIPFETPSETPIDGSGLELDARLRSLLNSAPVLISYVDANQQYRFTNKAYEDWFGLTAAELQGKYIWDVIGEAAYTAVSPHIATVLAGQAISYTSEVPYRNVGARHVQATLIPEFDYSNVESSRTVIGWTAFLKDITDYKRLEAELRRNNAQLRRLIDSNMVGVIFADLNGTISQVNDAFLQQMGYSREQWDAETPNWLSITPPEWLTQDAQRIEEILKSGSSIPFEKEYFRKDGSRIPVLVSAALLPETADQCICLVIDQSDRKQAQTALHLSEARFRQLADSMPQIVWAACPDGYLDYYNQRWYEFTGFSEGQGGDSSWEPILHPEDLQLCQESWYTAVKSRQPYKIEYRFWDRHTGTYRWHLGQALPAYDDAGNLTRWYGTCTDIDDQKRAQLEVQELNATLEQRVNDRTAQLETINKELESFSYSVSHDLRAPLRHIDGFVNLLQKRLTCSNLDETSQHYLRTIAETTQKAGILIDDLLTFSRMGRSEMRHLAISMNPLVAEIQRELELDTTHQAIRWQIQPLPTVHGDLPMMRQVLRNLMGNAAKYTRSRSIAEIAIGHIPADQEDIFFIRDNGIGFNMQYTHKLFGIFQRLHSDPQFEGTGIGLANVQRIIHRHGGRVWAEGTIDQGATFYFTLPKLSFAENSPPRPLTNSE